MGIALDELYFVVGDSEGDCLIGELETVGGVGGVVFVVGAWVLRQDLAYGVPLVWGEGVVVLGFVADVDEEILSFLKSFA